MQTNANTRLTQKQQNLLLGLVEGLSCRQAAEKADLHPSSASIILRRPEFREELNRLRSEAASRMASRLPALVDMALDVLEFELKFPSERRIRAVKLTLELAAKLSEGTHLVGNQMPDSDAVINV